MNLENSMFIGADRILDAMALTADDEAARNNRYQLALARLEAVTPRIFMGHMLDAIQSTDDTFGMLLQDATKRGDEKLVGKLVMRALNLWRHREAGERADCSGPALVASQA